MAYLPSDRIQIFVSSRLQECAEERTIVRNALESLNHDPIMFESAGARPYPPRSVYLKGVENSVFFIGIYKEGYGFVADDMDISGLEDEYLYSKTLGIPQLLYVRRNCNRDKRLETLVSQFTGPSTTVGHYLAPDELYEKVRDDVTALVADYVFRGKRVRSLSIADARVAAERMVPSERKVHRAAVEDEICSRLERETVVTIVGPMGSGKSVLLHNLAATKEWLLVECGEKTPRETLRDVTSLTRQSMGLEPMPFTQTEEAGDVFRACWQAIGPVTLVLDDVRSRDVVRTILEVANPMGERRLIMSGRDSAILPHHSVFVMPPFDRTEVRDFVAKNRETPILAGELDTLMVASKGNPLYLRYYTSSSAGSLEHTIKDYEIKAWSELRPRAREAVNYLSLSPRPLHLENLMALMSSEAGTAEEIAGCLSEAQGLLCDTFEGYSVFHSHAKNTIHEAIASSPQRLAFYAKRLAKWFSSKRDFTAAFVVLDNAGVDVPLKLLSLARRHAAIQGDTTSSLSILKRQIDIAVKDNRQPDLQNLMFSLAEIQGYAGQVEKALTTLDEIRELPNAEAPLVPIDELKFSILSWAKGDPAAIEGLNAAKQAYLREGKDWDAARVALNLSGSFIRAGDYIGASAEAEFALSVFSKHNDQYGAGLAKINLLSASSEIPEKAELAAMLLAEFKKKTAISPRQRAILLNLLTRQARHDDDIEGAKRYAEQAIQIGRELGDPNVVCINMINLGNAFRQEGDLDGALEHYSAADRIARECGSVQSEAWVQELMADIFNRKKDGRRAMQHARYAIGLAKGGVSRRTEGDAYEELAEACELIGDLVGARDAWLQLARLEMNHDRESEFGLHAFLRASRLLYKERSRKVYIDSYRDVLFGRAKIAREGLSNIEILVEELPSLLTCLPLTQIFEASVYHARLLFDGLPKLMVRQLYRSAVKLLLTGDKARTDEDVKILRAMLAFTMALPPDILTIRDLVEVGESLSQENPSFCFRAHPDGAAHWAIYAPFSKPVIVTLSQLDDSHEVGLVCLCLALLLASFAREISEEILIDLVPPRDEAYAYVINYDEGKKLLPFENIGLASMKGQSVVTRATHPKEAQTPIAVIIGSDIVRDWTVGKGRGNSGQILFAQFLRELVYHLFEGEIEEDALSTKVMSLVKRTVV